MKIAKIGLIVTTLVLMISCKKYEEKSLIIIRDCSATYLRDGDIDLPIMNSEELTEIDSGEVIIARYYFPRTDKVEIKYGDDCGIPHEYPRGEWIIVEEFE